MPFEDNLYPARPLGGSPESSLRMMTSIGLPSGGLEVEGPNDEIYWCRSAKRRDLLRARIDANRSVARLVEDQLYPARPLGGHLEFGPSRTTFTGFALGSW